MRTTHQEVLALAWARYRGTAREHSLLVPLLISHPHLAGPSSSLPAQSCGTPPFARVSEGGNQTNAGGPQGGSNGAERFPYLHCVRQARRRREARWRRNWRRRGRERRGDAAGRDEATGEEPSRGWANEGEGLGFGHSEGSIDGPAAEILGRGPKL